MCMAGKASQRGHVSFRSVQQCRQELHLWIRSSLAPFRYISYTGALGCYVELQGVTRTALVKGYAVWPDVFARIFLGIGPFSLSTCMWFSCESACQFDLPMSASLPIWQAVLPEAYSSNSKLFHEDYSLVSFRCCVHCGAGYLLYDTSNMLVYFKYLGDPSAIVHHMVFMFAAAYVLDQSIMAFPFIWLALGEISTPSVNLRCINTPCFNLPLSWCMQMEEYKRWPSTALNA